LLNPNLEELESEPVIVVLLFEKTRAKRDQRVHVRPVHLGEAIIDDGDLEFVFFTNF
jgi:hypothetical protein